MSDHASIFVLMGQAMAKVQAVGKNERNTQQNYSFRGVDAVVKAVGPVFRELGIVIVPAAVKSSYRDVQTSTGKPSRECTVTVTYRFYGPAGDFIDAEVPGESMDFGDKGAPKAMSVAYRTALLQALCIPTDDPDPDSQSHERAYDHNRDATARKGPEQTQQPDVWSTPAPEPVTDAAWLEDFRGQLVRAGKPSEVDELDKAAHLAFAEQRLTVDDARALKTEIDQRRAELKGELAGVAS